MSRTAASRRIATVENSLAAHVERTVADTLEADLRALSDGELAAISVFATIARRVAEKKPLPPELIELSLTANRIVSDLELAERNGRIEAARVSGSPTQPS